MPTPLQGDLGPEFLGSMMGVELLLAKSWALSRSAMSVMQEAANSKTALLLPSTIVLTTTTVLAITMVLTVLS